VIYVSFDHLRKRYGKGKSTEAREVSLTEAR
jgi:hypothetical protein